MDRKLINQGIIALTIIFITHGQAISQTHDTGEFDYEKRSGWLDQTKKSLKGFKPEMAEKKQSFKFREKDGMILQSCRIVGKGLIEFESGDWVYIVLHSSHEKDSIGDVAIAVDQKGRFFKHEGHVCGGICHYEALTSKKYETSKDFFKHFKDDTEGKSWEKLKK